MRKIEMMMNSAIRYRKNFSSGNTTVRAFKESVEVYLHGNNIASLDTATNELTILKMAVGSLTPQNQDLMHYLMSSCLACVSFKTIGHGLSLTV